MKKKIVELQEFLDIREGLRIEKKTVVAAGGCFDILHAGHVMYLEEAATMGDVLIVLLNSDISVKSNKGDTRPINPQKNRAIVLSGLECVEYIIIFEEKTPCEIIEKIKPDIFVKGEEYQKSFIPETKIVNAYGGQVKYIKMLDNCSTTNVIHQILKENENE
jgi:rfaE bifunctional protein nucleotidyltransferase chain/domain|nr:D-glycero-beta-D-manno-heptose 1-phosphate adenylyltransferase [uncultured Schaedlerella sp.]